MRSSSASRITAHTMPAARMSVVPTVKGGCAAVGAGETMDRPPGPPAPQSEAHDGVGVGEVDAAGATSPPPPRTRRTALTTTTASGAGRRRR